MKNKFKTLQVSCVQLHWAKSLEENVEKTIFYLQAAAKEKSNVVLFPEANLTSYYFPMLVKLPVDKVKKALSKVCQVISQKKIWAIVGTIQKTKEKFLNLAHVINPQGKIIYEYAKVHLAGQDEQKYCRPGNKLSLFEIEGILCTLIICRDGRHPELYRLPSMLGAKILFQPSCSSDEIEAVIWKRIAGRAQQPIGPNSKIFHCVANTMGQSPDGKQTSSGASFIREPSGMPLAEAGWYQEEMITAVLDLSRADGYYAMDSLNQPAFLKPYWEKILAEVKARANKKP